MIIVHLADLHLGYRAYSKTDAAGVNQREADVAAAFNAALESIPALAPDLVVIAGDLFHSVRPSNAAIATAFRGLSRLATSLPGLPIILVAGDRETPRTADTASILELFREIPGVRAITERVEAISLPDLNAEVVAAPHAALMTGAAAVPETQNAAATRILMAHGMAEGALVDDSANTPDGGAVIPAELLELESWDYVALGHLPVAAVLEPHIRYAGSLERTSGQPWAEAGVRKGFLVYDTEAGAAEFHEVPTRSVVDLPSISARGLSPAEVDAAIRRALNTVPGGIGGSIVRLVVTDLPRSTVRALDSELLARARATALHFLLDARAPAPEAQAIVPIRGRTLDQQVEHYLAEIWNPTQEGLDRQRLVQLGLEYLKRAGEEGRR